MPPVLEDNWKQRGIWIHMSNHTDSKDQPSVNKASYVNPLYGG